MVKLTKEEWLEALEIWKKDKPEGTLIKERDKVELANGKVALIGTKAVKIKKEFEILSEEEKMCWGRYLPKN